MASNLPEPKSRKESYLAKAAGMGVTIPEKPESREEQYLAAIAEGGGGGGGGSYTAGDGIVIDNNEISVNLAQTTGTSTTSVMSQKAVTDALASAGGGGAIELTTADYNWNISTHSATEPYTGIALWLLPAGVYDIPNDDVVSYVMNDAIYRAYKGLYIVSESSSQGRSIVFLGTQINAGGTSYGRVYGVTNFGASQGNIYIKGAVQTTGTSTTDVMSQNATTSMVFADPSTKHKVQVGGGVADNIQYGAAIGFRALATGEHSIAIGGGRTDYESARAQASGSIAIGAGSFSNTQGVISVGAGSCTQYGYNNTAYRLISGVHDGQTAHDAVTVEQVNATIDAINTALSTSIPHIGLAS